MEVGKWFIINCNWILLEGFVQSSAVCLSWLLLGRRSVLRTFHSSLNVSVHFKRILVNRCDFQMDCLSWKQKGKRGKPTKTRSQEKKTNVHLLFICLLFVCWCVWEKWLIHRAKHVKNHKCQETLNRVKKASFVSSCLTTWGAAAPSAPSTPTSRVC